MNNFVLIKGKIKPSRSGPELHPVHYMHFFLMSNFVLVKGKIKPSSSGPELHPVHYMHEIQIC